MTQRSVVLVRLTAEDRARVVAAAERSHRTVSSWLRDVALRALDAEEAQLTETSEPGQRKRGKGK